MGCKLIYPEQRPARNSYPFFPLDIEREIFEWAAACGDWKIIPILCQVAWRVNIWVRPSLYRYLRIDSQRVAVPPIYHTPSQRGLDMKKLDSFAPHVKTVMLQGCDAQVVANVLSRCLAIEDLTLWLIRGDTTVFLPLLAALPLKNLNMDPRKVLQDSYQVYYLTSYHGIFKMITHLEIINPDSSWPGWTEIAALKHLTHLALHGLCTQEMAKIHPSCITMEMLILVNHSYSMRSGFTCEMDNSDPRVVWMTVPLNEVDALDAWERGARGDENSIWEKVKSLGKIKGQ